MLQWHTRGGWTHRAYRGANVIDWGTDGTPERLRMGDLPAAGRWTRLDVPVKKLKVSRSELLDGWAFTQFDGTVDRDRAGLVTETPQDGQLLNRSPTGNLKSEKRGKDTILTDHAANVRVDRDVVLDLFDLSSIRYGVKALPARFVRADLDGQTYLALRYRPDLPGRRAAAARLGVPVRVLGRPRPAAGPHADRRHPSPAE